MKITKQLDALIKEQTLAISEAQWVSDYDQRASVSTDENDPQGALVDLLEKASDLLSDAKTLCEQHHELHDYSQKVSDLENVAQSVCARVKIEMFGT